MTTSPASHIHTHKRMVGLDGLRFVAAIMVMLFHYTYESLRRHDMHFFGSDTLIPSITMYFFSGVYLFFIISGFVISLSIQKYATRRETAWRFLRARLLRLVPLFFFCVALTTLVTIAFGGPQRTVTLLQIAANATFFANMLHQPLLDGVYWTLQIEWVFYIAVMALLMLGLLPERRLIFTFVWLLSIFILNILNLDTFALSCPQYFSQFFCGSLVFELSCQLQFAPFFCIGILLYELRRSPTNPAAYLLLFVAMVLATSGIFTYDTFQPHYAFTTNPATMSVVVALLVVLVTMTIWWEAWPFPKALVFLGGISYPLYLVHGQMGYIFFEHTYGQWPNILVLGTAIVVALSLATVLATMVEPRLRRRLAKLLPQQLARKS